MTYRVPAHITWKVLKSGTVLLNLKDGNYFTLNPTASLIWEELSGDRSIDEAIMAICAAYECSEKQAAADIRDTVAFLTREGLIEVSNLLDANKNQGEGHDRNQE